MTKKSIIKGDRSKISMVIFIILIMFCLQIDSIAQKPATPIPMEIFAGNKEIYYQMVIKRPFAPESKFSIFGLATYSANYENEVSENRAIIINQIS